MKIKGILELWQLDAKTGKIKKYIKKHNTVLTSGKNHFWTHGGRALLYIGIGTDATAPDASQTGLLAEERLETITDRTSADNVITVSRTFIEWSTPKVITEAGVRFSSAVYFNRVTFAGVTCDSTNNIKIKFTITITD